MFEVAVYSTSLEVTHVTIKVFLQLKYVFEWKEGLKSADNLQREEKPGF
jgi:hypothetical protein